MKDKEKQIQEIAQIICGRSKDDICIIDNTSCNSSCCWARNAEAIYNVGYRKHPKDSIVLSREELSKALTDNFNMGKKEAQFYSKRVAIPTARKETVREILNAVDNESNGQTISITNYLRKKYGVEVEE